MKRGMVHIIWSGRIIWMGIILAVCYWFFESFVDSQRFRSGSLNEEVFSPAPDELWMRIIIIALILAFSIYAHVAVVRYRRIEAALKETEKMQQALLSSTGEAAMLLEPDGKITALNDIAARVLRAPPDRLIGKNVFNIMPPHIAKVRRAQKKKVVETNQPIRFEDEQNGRWFDIGVYPVSDSTGKTTHWAIYSREITDQKKMEQELVRLSITDNLTGLFNQRHFTRKIEEEADRAVRMKYPLCLVIFDVDNLKTYNDTYGHLKGDEILRTIGVVTNRSIRKDVDSGFRYGGDEFALILPYADMDTAREIVERIGERVVKKTGGVTLSFGISALSKEVSVHDLIHRADRLMYEMKARGKDGSAM
jgi:diguanylate cyclase (GGDEF)-like protein/PAS domain S-box-containing protein